jgi:hypothetical protein
MTQRSVSVALLLLTIAAAGALPSGCTSREPTTSSRGAGPTTVQAGALTAEAPPPTAEPTTPGAGDYEGCRACWKNAKVCACDEDCMKCLYVSGSEVNCPRSASFYREACNCLRIQCPGVCPVNCKR